MNYSSPYHNCYRVLRSHRPCFSSHPNVYCSIPSTVPSVFPAIRHPFHSTTVQNPLYPGTNTWRSPHHGVMELGDPHTAQEVLLKQVRQIVASKAPLGFTDKTLPLIQPAKSFQNANILEEMRPREREVVQEKRPPLVAMRNDSIPSPKPLGPENRMGSDDLLSDENIEKMEKSYSDDEGWCLSVCSCDARSTGSDLLCVCV